ncbi:hypothetical protein HDV04_005887 [Boothiomyces sp. JEL0838]|nr:hypothetical protein HDV04_005887 [Boothiomyces sp. JEL0838]
MLSLIFATAVIATTLDFKADYSTAIEGKLVAGTDAIVKYDLYRAKCDHAHEDGFDTWGVYLNYAFNDDFSNTVTTAIARSPTGTLEYYTPSISLKRGKLAIWVFCSSEMDTTYDSNYGKNWIFNVE